MCYCIMVLQAWREVTQPKSKWGPALPENRTDHRYGSDFEPKAHYNPTDMFHTDMELNVNDDYSKEKNGMVNYNNPSEDYGHSNPTYTPDAVKM